MNIFTCTIHAEHTRNEFYHSLSIRGTNFIACWAYWEPISSHAEHARKCLKVKYIGRIEYDFQKSRVTGPWDHKVSVSAKKVLKKFHACVPLNRLHGKGNFWRIFLKILYLTLLHLPPRRYNCVEGLLRLCHWHSQVLLPLNWISTAQKVRRKRLMFT